MKALVYNGPRDVSVNEVPDATIVTLVPLTEHTPGVTEL